jgi:hypothetical protein
MQSSHGPPPHGSTPSPTDHTNAHIPAQGSFNTSESIPPSPHFFAMNPLTDQRLTGSVMPYQPIDHHPLSRYALLLHPARHCIVTVGHPISCHTHISTPTYQDTVPWQYASSWDTPVLDTAPPENPPSTPLHTLGGMVSASTEGSSFAPSLPPPSAVQSHTYYRPTQA